MGTLVGAGVGARLLAWLQNPVWLIRHAWDASVWMSGETLVGALLGGLIGVEVAKKCVGWTKSTGDAFVAPLIIGISIGRVGCFLAGLQDETYGTPTTWFTGVNFGDGVRRHPTQLYEIAFVLTLGAVLWIARTRAKRTTSPFISAPSKVSNQAVETSATLPLLLQEGVLFQLFMISYLAFRLAVEFIEFTPHIYFGLSNIQIACILGLGYYLPKFTRQWRRQKANAKWEAQHA